MTTVKQVNWRPAFLGLLAAVALAPAGYGQGSLIPPGPPGPTMKTLAQVEPRTPVSALPFSITNSGSYYLAGNLTGLPGRAGIVIAASDVTLDLNGFALIGVADSLGGIVVSGNRTNLVVSNGTIRNWGQTGLNGYTLIYCGRFKDLIVSSNAASGLQVGYHCVVSDCVAYANRYGGIDANAGSVVANCIASYNGAGGFYGQYFILRDSTASFNDGAGIHVFNYARVFHCHSVNNAADGIALGSGCHALENTCLNNNSSGSAEFAGIRTFYQTGHIEGNYVQFPAGIGIFVNTNAGFSSTGWTVAKNRTRGPAATAYVYRAGNDIGPIGDAATATSPWANLRN